MSNCETTPHGPRLQKNSHRLVESGPNTNGNGRLDPGETFSLPVTLFNGGDADALNVAGRLRSVDPTQGRVLEPAAGWSDIAVATELESNAPHFDVTLFEDGISCGETFEVELEMDADNAAPRDLGIAFVLGEKDLEFPINANLAMSRFVTDPVVSTFAMTEDEIVSDLDVTVNVNHTAPGTLIVELSSPLGTTVRLHDLSPGDGGINTRYDLLTAPDGPGTMADFEGESTAGFWSLSVQNTQFGGRSGTFVDWTLHVTAAGGFDCDALSCVEPVPGFAPDGLLVEQLVDGRDGSHDLVFSWNGVGGAAGYHVLQSATPTFDGVVDLSGRTAGPVTLSVEDGVNTTPALTYFQVRAVNACNEESP